MPSVILLRPLAKGSGYYKGNRRCHVTGNLGFVCGSQAERFRLAWWESWGEFMRRRRELRPEPEHGNYFNCAYSALASFRMGMSGSASFQRVRKFLYAAFALAVSPCMT